MGKVPYGHSIGGHIYYATRRWIRRMWHGTDEPARPVVAQTPVNRCIVQGFEWHSLGGGQHYQRLSDTLQWLHDVGVSAVWLPPACKASSPESNGYDIYDLYDLGEFDQKGSVATKWGTKSDLDRLVSQAKKVGIGLMFDAVVGHKAGADRKEPCIAVEVRPNDRNREIGARREIDAWLGFDFPGRGERYSSLKYNQSHFNGTDYDAKKGFHGVYKVRDWAQDVDLTRGNWDYLMFANLDLSNQEVREDIKNWSVWVAKELNLCGFRVDAIKHISRGFLNEWFTHLKDTVGNCEEGGGPFTVVGEHWTPDADILGEFLDQFDLRLALFDPVLLYRLAELPYGQNVNFKNLFDGTLVKARPNRAVTIVSTHDTQPGQIMDTPVTDWFVPLAYALILLRQEGIPCVFFGDLYGIRGPEPHGPRCHGQLPDLMYARWKYAYGPQKDYFDSKWCVGWTREGTWDRPNGLAVLMSIPNAASKRMYVGKQHAGETWKDALSDMYPPVTIDKKGFGRFRCLDRSVSVWVNWDSSARHGFAKYFNDDFYGTRATPTPRLYVGCS